MSGVKSFLKPKTMSGSFGAVLWLLGETHNNPTAAEFHKDAQALRVVNSFRKTSPVSNCRGSMADGVDAGKENRPLPKRRTKRVLKPKCKE